MAPTIEDLVRQVDAARTAGDADEVQRLEREVKAWTRLHGKRSITGKLDFNIPSMSWSINLRGAKEGFDQWNKGSG